MPDEFDEFFDGGEAAPPKEPVKSVGKRNPVHREPPASQVSSPPPQKTFTGITPEVRKQFRGIGEIYNRDPIAAVVEVMKRGRVGDKWQFVRPFTRDVSKDAEFAFNIMEPVPTTEIMRGTKKTPAREGHARFASFNECEPKFARTIRGNIIHWREAECFRYSLGAFQAPPGHDNAEKGWWCRGDAKKAIRWVNGKFGEILCPGRLCEFQQERFGPSGNARHCKPHLTLIAQFDWESGNLPNSVFQFDSQSWNNISNLEGMFKLIRDTATQLGYKDGEFPVFGLPFTMHVKQRHQGMRKFPEVSFSIEGSLMDWMSKLHNHIQSITGKNNPLALEGPKPLQLEEGPNRERIEAATEAALNPNYRPANER